MIADVLGDARNQDIMLVSWFACDDMGFITLRAKYTWGIQCLQDKVRALKASSVGANKYVGEYENKVTLATYINPLAPEKLEWNFE